MVTALVIRCSALLLALLATGETSGRQPTPASDRLFDHVFVISVDGLRSDAIPAGGPGRLPTFHRLLGASSTLNARTDPEFTVTLPNHTSMITGRPTAGAHGHGWRENSEPPEGETLHTRAGFEVVSMFDVAHGHGIRTGCFFSKSKFSLWIRSFNAGREPPRTSIVRAAFHEGMSEVTDEAIAVLKEWDRGLVFLHYALPDRVGHEHGWDISPDSPFMASIIEIDGELGRLLDEIASGTRRCAVIVTSDHGGGYPFRTHLAAHMWVNYIIPFLVWTSDEAPSIDLYEINREVRRDPSLDRPPCAEPDDEAGQRMQPVRNGDAANLALHLLGLPPVPGSIINSRQDLRILGDAAATEVRSPDP